MQCNQGQRLVWAFIRGTVSESPRRVLVVSGNRTKSAQAFNRQLSRAALADFVLSAECDKLAELSDLFLLSLLFASTRLPISATEFDASVRLFLAGVRCVQNSTN